MHILVISTGSAECFSLRLAQESNIMFAYFFQGSLQYLVVFYIVFFKFTSN